MTRLVSIGLPVLERQVLTRRTRWGPVVRHNLIPGRMRFTVRAVDDDDAPIVLKARCYGRTLDYRAHQGITYRRVLDPSGKAADIAVIENVDAMSLISRWDERNLPWLDHPSYLDATLTSPEEPLRQLIIRAGAVPTGWRVDQDPCDEDAFYRVQARLDECLLVQEDELWCRSPPPGLSLRVFGEPRASRWLPRFSVHWQPAVLFDFAEAEAAEALAKRLAIPEADLAYHYKALQPRIEHMRGADMEMLRHAVRAMSSSVRRSISELGNRVAASFWAARVVIDDDDHRSARDWLARASADLAHNDTELLRKHAQAMQLRVQTIRQPY